MVVIMMMNVAIIMINVYFQAAESCRPSPACVEVTNALWLFSRHRAGEDWFTTKVMVDDDDDHDDDDGGGG